MRISIYVTNGGFGGVLLALKHGLPMVVAGLHEGKNEIASRIGYFNFGINLNTETPKVEATSKAVETVANSIMYKVNVRRLADEFAD
ncbi:hypothetical protein IC229_17030 [Spirosoma sp. BT702]|uniref:Uncharacterized protein n=1 Tax=Spirosoma profusum TaxID=2771354 RepID=A0A927ARJ7_9BACT|nr:hypothetical protein [Spirosoma profusum]MBD2702356.1 hypothetical protein [Spirosoma profusum]